MKLRAPAIEVPEKDPFKFDLLGLESSAVMLTEIVRSTDDALVVGIDADWGRGKTTFLRMWIQYLKNEGLNPLYFNAWESDFSDDAFVSIIGELELGMSELSAVHVKKAKKSLEKAKKVGMQIVKRTLPAALKIATAGVLSLDDFTETALAEVGEKLAAEKIESYENSKKSVVGFKDALMHFAHDLVSKNEAGDKLPLVIVVDELDRCRPTYAIDILESIKHFFSVPGIVFVIAADWSQLGNVVRTRYGIDAEVSGYLRRFIDVNFSLPSNNGEKFTDAQYEKFGLMEFFNSRSGQESRYDLAQLKELLPILFKTTNSSYRDQERCFTLLSLAIRATPQNMRLYALYLSVLIVVKVKNPILYKEYMSDPTLYEKVFEYLKIDSAGRKLFGDVSGYGPVVEAHFIKGADEIEGRHSNHHAQAISLKAADPKTSELEKERLNRILEVLAHHSFRDHYQILEYLRRKIDFVAGGKSA